MKPIWTRDFSLAFAANFLMAFSFYLLLPTLPLLLVGEYRASPGAAGLVLSAYVVAAIAVRPFSGWLIDALPRKRLYVAAFAVFALLAASHPACGSVASLGILRFVYGLAWGVITTSANTVAIDILPSQRRGEGIGLFGLSMNVAMALGPSTGIALAASGPFSRVFALATATAALGFAASLAIRVPSRPLHPETRALSLDRFLLLEALPAGGGLLLVTVSYGAVLTYAAVLGRERGIPGTGLFFLALAAGILIARAGSGRLLDRGFSRGIASLGALVAAAGLLLLSAGGPSWGFFASAFAMGLGYGMNYPAVQSRIVEMGGHQRRGTANSTYYIAFDLGVGLGIFLAGQLAQRWSLSAAFALSAVGAVAGAFALSRALAPPQPLDAAAPAGIDEAL